MRLCYRFAIELLLVLNLPAAGQVVWPQGSEGEVPDKLFGIRLGDFYQLGPSGSNDKRDLPVKRVSRYSAFDMGTILNFEPLQTYRYFNFKSRPVQRRDGTIDPEAFGSPFQCELLRHVSDPVKNESDMTSITVSGEVISIMWGEPYDTLTDSEQRVGASWAKEICDAIARKIRVMPKDTIDSGILYSCTFETTGRTLKIDSIFGRNIFLGFDDKTRIRKVEEIKRREVDLVFK